jgi:eukaryotic-like serine/threonine-protein kinase
MRPSATSCERCGSSLPPGARFCANCGAPIGSADATRVSQPKQVIDGRYLVLQELGQGAFGITYLVRDMTADATRVLKLRERADPGIAERITAEARVVGAIRHPNLAAVLGSGLTPAGVPYLVLEHVPGPNLHQILQDGPLAMTDALAVARGIGGALQALHARSVVHRDVKPGNIVVPEEDGAFQFRRAALIDFGVFGELTRRRSGAGVTAAGQIFGTPVYMAPEQLAGEAQSAATDVFGLGLVLFEMLTGEQPFGGKNTSERVFRRLISEVELPESVALAPALRGLIQGMLRRNPLERTGLPQVLAAIRSQAEDTAQSGAGGASPPVAGPRGAGGADTPVSAPSPRAVGRAEPSRLGLVVGVLGLAAVLLTILTFSLGNDQAWFAGLGRLLSIMSGFAIAGCGIGLGLLVRQLAATRRPALQIEAGQVLFGAQSRAALTATLAVQVDQLVGRCRAMGEAYWGQTVALMLKEYEEAREAKDRREALMNVATLLEKVTGRLSPWYVRYEKLLAVTATIVGILGGGWKIISEVIHLAQSGPR